MNDAGVSESLSATRIRPFLEFEDRPAPRLEALPEVVPAPPVAAVGTGSAMLASAGAAVLVVGLAALQTGNFVVDQFARGPVLGGLTLLIALAGFGLLGVAFWRELRGLLALRGVEALRRELRDPAGAKAGARRWVEGLPEGAALLPSLAAIDDPQAILALLRAGPAAALRARAEALGRTAAVQVFAATAAVPSPAFDGLLVLWRGVRLVREVAELHGVRPGLFATLTLLRRTAFAAAGVMATDLAINTATRAVLSSPLLQKITGDLAGAGVAARRMMVLAQAAALACQPLDEVV